ncbi:signal peptidase I [mine drainage metagenome]|uniref:signal peptidase I n=1 Tax=mine drainage metagenome TaxID=410659 RepID=A0A1J5P584_9ZZZZ
MSTITGLLYGALIIYLGGWYVGKWDGNFELLLFVLSVVTLAYWLAEHFVYRPGRERAAAALEANDVARRTELGKQGIAQIDGDVSAAKHKLLAQPWWLDWTAGLFPVILAVFLLRSFLFEPFKIPSGSMIPTLLVGDLILVNKFEYGIRLPVIHKKIFAIHDPQRGDVMVFRYPENPSVDYIKRVVGLPGDKVAYINKRLTINGKPIETKPLPDFYDVDSMRYSQQFSEKLGKVAHRMLNNRERAPFVMGVHDFEYRGNCRYSLEGVECTEPPGHYFMMGDNRDNSEDSRYWGFVPDENIVGKAFFIWMNFSDPKRVGPFH